jgi:hypothetical protein
MTQPTAPHILRYEADPNDIRGSVIRYQWAAELMQQRRTPVTPEMLCGFLADREHAPG